MNQEEMLTQIMNAVSTLQESMTTMQGSMTTMQESVSTLQEDLSSFKEDVKEEFTAVKGDLTAVKGDLTAVKQEVSTVKGDTQRTREIVTRMEIEHGQKLGALFDANSMNYDKIKEEITPILEKHDDDIEKLKIHVSGLRRVK